MEERRVNGATAKGCLIMIGAALLLGLAIATCTAGDSKPRGEPGTIAGLSSEFEVPTRLGDELLVPIVVEHAWDDKDWLDRSAGLIERAGRAMKAGELTDDEPPLQTVKFQIAVMGTDRLGEPVEIPLFKLMFDASDLRRANYDALTSYGVLGLATNIQISSRHGREVLAAWCEDPTRRDLGRGFCLRALLG